MAIYGKLLYLFQDMLPLENRLNTVVKYSCCFFACTNMINMSQSGDRVCVREKRRKRNKNSL